MDAPIFQKWAVICIIKCLVVKATMNPYKDDSVHKIVHVWIMNSIKAVQKFRAGHLKAFAKIMFKLVLKYPGKATMQVHKLVM